MAVKSTTHNVLQMPERSAQDRVWLRASFDYLS
jgi:hypothetical protein